MGICLFNCTRLEEIEAVFGDKLAETIEEAGERVHKERSNSLEAEERRKSEVAEYKEFHA